MLLITLYILSPWFVLTVPFCLQVAEHEPKATTGNEPCGPQDGALARLSLLRPVHIRPSKVFFGFKALNVTYKLF